MGKKVVNIQKRKVAVFSTAGLGGLVLILAIWGMVFQAGFASVPARASNIHEPESAKKVIHSSTPQQKDAGSSPAGSSGQSPELSPQVTDDSSALSGTLTNSGQNKSPTQSQPANIQLTGPAADVVWSVPTAARAVFVTVDDGWYPSDSVLAIMRVQHIPMTAFLIANAAQEHPDYWRAFVAAGGDIENHTLSHPDLAKDSPQQVNNQINAAQQYLSTFPAPTLFRPPYGDYSQTVCQAVYQAGIKHLVMWDAIMDANGLQTYNGKSLEPGSIILLHWNPSLGTQLQKLLDILKQEHLGVASLPVALQHPDKYSITWPLSQAPD